MARTLLDALRAAVRRYDLLAPGDRVLVAVSGGADSVALLSALHELRDALGIEVVAAHLDHGLRGAESVADRAFVERLTADLGVPLRCEEARVSHANLEAEARRARYAFLERAASSFAASKIATAHTQDDQAETVLARVLKGSGRRGLLGIPPRRGRIIRPLILCDRVQVRSFLVERDLEWRRDRSNFDLGRERARLRAGFLPALAREFNPRLTSALARLADVLRDEDAVLDRLATTALGTEARLDGAVLSSLDAPIARRGVRQWWRRHGSGRRLGAVHVEAALALLGRESGGQVRVPGGTIERRERWLVFRPGAEEPTAPPYELALALDGDVTTPDGWRLRLCAASPAMAPAPGDAVCVVDADQVAQPLTVRSRRPGDRMRPLGLDGHTSIKRLLIARRVPRPRRDGYPLVVAGGAVLWVPGCARSDLALVTAATRRAWVIRAERGARRAPRADRRVGTHVTRLLPPRSLWYFDDASASMRKGDQTVNQLSRNLALWLLLVLMVLLLVNLFTKQPTRDPEISFSDFLSAVEKGEVAEVTIQGQDIRGKRDHRRARSRPSRPTTRSWSSDLREKGVEIEARREDGEPWYVVASSSGSRCCC